LYTAEKVIRHWLEVNEFMPMCQLKICVQLSHIGVKVLKETCEGNTAIFQYFWTYKPIVPSCWHSFKTMSSAMCGVSRLCLPVGFLSA